MSEDFGAKPAPNRPRTCRICHMPVYHRPVHAHCEQLTKANAVPSRPAKLLTKGTRRKP